MTVIALRNISKKFLSGDKVIPIIDSIDLQVSEGECVAITGPSGSGKTTLLNIMSGLDLPDLGEVNVLGQSLTALSQEARINFRHNRIAMIFQDFCLFDGLTAYENVKMMLPKGESIQCCQTVLAQVGLWSVRDSLAYQLSGGEKQRVAIARALVKKPKLMFADEPTAQLDQTTSSQVVKLLLTLRAEMNMTLVMVTHDLGVANQCDRVVSMGSLGVS